MRVLILAGGKGTRLGLGSPKSLFKVNGKPLISYQLKELCKIKSISKVMISVNTKAQEELFKLAITNGEFPALEYEISIHPYGHQTSVFLIPEVQEFIKGNDFLWSYGDVVFNEELIQSMISLHALYNFTVATFSKAKYDYSIRYLIDEHGFVSLGAKNSPLGLYMPIFVEKKDGGCLIEGVAKGRKEDDFAVDLVNRKALCGVDAPEIFDINTSDDLSKFQSFLNKRREANV